jgi:hypothetical protein
MAQVDMDDETRISLLLFNQHLDLEVNKEQETRKLKKAERAKDEAAAAVRKLKDGGDAEAVAGAEAAYRQALEQLQRLQRGEELDEPPTGEETEATEDALDEPPTEDALDEPEPAGG